MSRPLQSRAEWLGSIRSSIEPIGDCMEWQGDYFGPTPVVYSPAGYAWTGSSKGKQSVRSVLYKLSTGERVPAGKVIRPRCWNERCVHEDHFGLIPRAKQSKEQSRRGELQTPKALLAKLRSSRKRAKLTEEQVEAILVSKQPSKVEAARHGVSRQTITDIRSSRMRTKLLPAASVFAWARAA